MQNGEEEDGKAKEAFRRLACLLWEMVSEKNVSYIDFFFFLPYPQHMEFPRPGVKSQPQLQLMYAIASQCRIFNPMGQAGDQTRTSAETKLDP